MEILSCAVKFGFLVFLAIAAFADLKRRCLNIVFIYIGLTAGFVLQTALGELLLWEMAAGVAVGGAAALISKVSRQAVGYGDSFMAAACGAWLGFYGCVFLLTVSLFIMALFGIAALALKKAKGKDALPFMPFLLAGYIVMLAV